MKYIRINKGLRDNAYKLIPASDDIYTHIDDNKRDYYSSIFQYNQQQYDQWKSKGSIAGIKDVTTNKLVWDFDSKTNVEESRQDALSLISKLIKDGVAAENIQVAFSGNKGFAVSLDTTDEYTPNEFKNITSSLAEGLKTFDPVVSDPARIFRVLGTKHNVSGLYKYPLSVQQLSECDVEVIKEMAAGDPENNVSVMEQWVAVNVPKSYKDLKYKAKEEKIVVEKVSHDLDMTRKPKWLSEAKYALQCGYFDSGERNTALMVLCATYNAQGIPKVVTYRMLKGVAELQSQRTGSEQFDSAEIWNNIVNVVYGPHWSGGAYGPDHPLLKAVTERLGLKETKTVDTPLIGSSDVAGVFKLFASDIDKNTIKLGIDKIDKEIRITTSMLVGLLAPPSAGKTTISLSVLNSISNAGLEADFYSLDMGAPLVYQRLIQKHMRYSSDKIFNMYKKNDPNVHEIESIIQKEYKNIRFCFKSGLTVDDIRSHLNARKEQEGKVSKLLVIDYLECIQGPYSDSTANTSLIAQQLKDLANEFAICILLLLQPQKTAGDPSSELLSYRNIKGSSAIEQACSIIFTMWRPGFSPKTTEDDKFLTIAVVKNRMGQLGLYNFSWDGLSGDISELDEFEKEDLEKLIARKAKEKQQEL